MYKISAPVMNQTVTQSTRDIYLEQCKKAKIDRLFLCTDNYKIYDEELLKENIRFFTENGVETAIWVGATIGHIGVRGNSHCDSDGKYYFRTIDGDYIQGLYCPLDEKFTDEVGAYLAKLAKLGVAIQLDDDYRFSYCRGETLCCCCDRHLAKMSEFCGEPVTIDTLKEKAFRGGKNIYRDAWLKAQGESLLHMARKLRKAVDEVDESILLNVCTAWSTWGIDGASSLEITRVLAGKNSPRLRVNGAPYWQAVGGWHVVPTIEIARMFCAFSRDGETEVVLEGDVWPRPRYQVPSSYLELFDGVGRLSGDCDGCLKYMFDYVSSPAYETGYIDRHTRNLPVFERLGAEFDGAENEGVRVYVYPNTIADMDLPNDYPLPALASRPYPSGELFATNGIYTVYEGEGICGAAFGENIKYVPKSALEKGMIIDAVAAKYLFEKGVDVGIEKWNGLQKTFASNEQMVNGETVRVENDCYYLDADYKEGVQVESYVYIDAALLPGAIDTKSSKRVIASYRYENASGQKFFVLATDIESAGPATYKHTYARQKQLFDAIAWIAGRKMPVAVLKQPELYVLTKRKGKELYVALFNVFADGIYDEPVILDKEYKKLRCLHGNIAFENGKVKIKELPAFSFAAFVLEE